MMHTEPFKTGEFASRDNRGKPATRRYLEQAPGPDVGDTAGQTIWRPASSMGESNRQARRPGKINRARVNTRRAGRDFPEQLIAGVQANPVPLVLMASGVAWFLATNDRPASHRGRRTSARVATGMGGKIRSFKDTIADGLSELASDARQAQASAKEKLDAAGRQLSSRADQASRRIGEAGAAATDQLSEAKGRIADGAKSGRDIANQAAGKVNWLYREQPVSLALVGLAAGAVIGALIPRTRREDELFGEYSDQLAGKARRGVASELEAARQRIASQAESAVDNAVESAGESIRKAND